MTDQRLQTARRAAALDPSPEARAAWLRERLRSQDTPCGECQGVGRLPIRVRDKNGNVTPLEISAAKARQLGMSETLCQVAEAMRTGLPCPSCAGTGLTLRPRVELAAYCGDEGAQRALVGEGMILYHRIDGVDYAWTETSLGRWLSGLSRWGQEALVRAAVAAARVALPEWAERECDEGHNPDLTICPLARVPLRAIEAAEAWIACPCEEHARACLDMCPLSIADENGWWGWLLAAVFRSYPATCFRDYVPWEEGLGGHFARLAIDAAARIAGEAPVREAIQRALIAWALG